MIALDIVDAFDSVWFGGLMEKSVQKAFRVTSCCS